MIRKLLVAGCVLLAVGCKQSQSVPAEAKPQSVATLAAPAAPAAVPVPNAAATGASSSEWKPETKGLPIDLLVNAQKLSFCDDRGPREVSLASGVETAGTQQCPKDDDQNASEGCPDSVEIVGGPDGGNDAVNFEGRNYPLKGMSRACASADGKVIVSTYKQVLLIDGAANNASVVSTEGGDRVALGGGWVAWRTLDEKSPLHVKAIASLSGVKARK